MECPINIREAQHSDIEQICSIQESTLNFQDQLTQEILEERLFRQMDSNY